MVGRYTSDYFKGAGAIVYNRYGNGSIVYCGSAFQLFSAQKIMEKLGVVDPYSNIIELPQGCELAIREKNRVKYFFVLNYLNEMASLCVKEKLYNLLNCVTVKGKISLAAYGISVYKAMI